MIWAGPGWNDPNLLIDIYVLSDLVLYNYALKMHEESAAVAAFLDSVISVALHNVLDTTSP